MQNADRIIAAGKLIVLAGMSQLSSPALAHSGHGQASLSAGLLHPLLGLDHVAAMLAVGLLAARLGGKFRWMLPASFVSTMAVGIALGANTSGPALEIGVALSVIALGVWLLEGGKTLPMASGVAVTGVAGALHGWAHATDAASHPSSLWFIAGVLCATAILHLFGLLLGTVALEKAARLRQTGWWLAGASVTGAGLFSLGL